MGLRMYSWFMDDEVFRPKYKYTIRKRVKGSIHKVFIENVGIEEFMSEELYLKCLSVVRKRKMSEKNKRKLIRRVFINYCFQMYQQLVSGEILNIDRKVYIVPHKINKNHYQKYVADFFMTNEIYPKMKMDYYVIISENLRKRMWINDKNGLVNYNDEDKLNKFKEYVFKSFNHF